MSALPRGQGLDGAPSPSSDRIPSLVGLYTEMLRIRRFEDRAFELFQEGAILGTAHSCVGQEAVAVGVPACSRSATTSSATIAATGMSLPKAAICTR